MNDLYTPDDFIEATIELRKAQEWLRRAKSVKPLKLPFSINGLNDEDWIAFKAHESERTERIELAKNEVERTARNLRDLEAYLSIVLPYGVWVLHNYRHPKTGQIRKFAIGLAYDNTRFFKKYAIRILIVDSEEDLRKQPPLKWEHRHYQLVPEWEHATRELWRA